MNRMAVNHVIAVDLGGTKLAVALVNGKGQLSELTTLAVDTSSSLAPVNQIVKLARELIGTKDKFPESGRRCRVWCGATARCGRRI